jgi:hypothetical protein
MKNNPFATLLEGALAFSVVFSVFMCIRLVVHTRDLRTYNSNVQGISAANQNLRLLVADCQLYSRQNPAINPILDSIHANPNPAASRGAR